MAQKLNGATVSEMRKMYKCGYTVDDICSVCGVTPTTFYNYKNRLCWGNRPKPGKPGVKCRKTTNGHGTKHIPCPKGSLLVAMRNRRETMFGGGDWEL